MSSWGSIHQVFRDTTYQRDSYLAGLRHLTRAKRNYLQRDFNTSRTGTAIRFLGEMLHRNRREKFIRRFAQDCERFFRSTLLSDSDHAFFTTVSELELMGLAAYLATQPRTLQVQWHLQFHFNLFDGRTPEYDDQLDVARVVQSCFDAALARIPYHAVHFYTTSETLGDQYNRLGVGDFQVLPYPVSPAFGGATNTEESVPAKFPLRITCAGGIRREKGQSDYLQPLIDKIWEPFLGSGKAKIVVQRPASTRLKKQKLELRVPPSPPSSNIQKSPIEYRAHPLSDDEYVAFIKSADCGLLFYDSRVYFSRRAGVMGEMLTCGKPVIVPAGCWLAEQIQNPIHQHAEQLANDETICRQFDIGEIRCGSSNVPLPGGIVSFDQFRHPFNMKFDRLENETGFLIRFDWHWPDVPGVYARIEVNEFDADHQSINKSRQVVGQRRGFSDSTSWFPLKKQTQSVELTLRNAFHDSNASVKNVEIMTVALKNDSVPRGAVGIIAADEDDLPNCIDELVQHYDHYRRTAEIFSKSWSRKHQPDRTIAHLISNDCGIRRAA